jgi:hypothetical protein
MIMVHVRTYLPCYQALLREVHTFIASTIDTTTLVLRERVSSGSDLAPRYADRYFRAVETVDDFSGDTNDETSHLAGHGRIGPGTGG